MEAFFQLFGLAEFVCAKLLLRGLNGFIVSLDDGLLRAK